MGIGLLDGSFWEDLLIFLYLEFIGNKSFLLYNGGNCIRLFVEGMDKMGAEAAIK